MRPDEHKKKKNAAYKKKHGISNASIDTCGKDKEDNKKKSKNKQQARNQIDKRDKSGQPSYSPRKENDKVQQTVSSDADSDDSGEQTSKRKQFSRRQVVSNWKKYEIEPVQDDDRVVARGENYEMLLGTAGEAMSRFRFRDELEWDEERTTEHPGDTAEEFQSSTLNPSDLWQSLSCIPLHQLLEIDESLFPKDQLDSLQQTASKNQAIYFSKNAKGRNPDSIHRNPTRSDPPDMSDSTRKDNGTDSLNDTSTPKHCEESTKPNRTPASDNPVCVIFPSDVNACVKVKPENCIGDGKFEQTLYQDVGDVTYEQTSHQSIQPQTLGFKDDDLDKLLDLDLESKEGERAANSSQVSKFEETNAKESEELEDWLDSILD